MTAKRRALEPGLSTWRHRVAAGLGATLLCALALLPRAAHAEQDPPGRVGRITESQGQAWQYDAEGGEWLALQRNRPITAGDRLSVEGGGRVELRIGSTAVRLDGASELEVRRLDDERIELQLHSGSAALRVRSPEVAREVELDTAEGRFLPRRAGHYRIDRRDDTSFATAWSGEIRFESPDSVLNIPAGRSAEFWQEGAQRTTHYSWVEPQRDRFADWVARANSEDDRSASTRYVSPEMTGWEDLDRNGRWDNHPEYGAIWVPTVVAADWAPYRYGHWAWVRPWGWTWVDDAPWGFAPFHYGRWVSYGGHWCWAPGRYVARPVYAPALVAWVGGPSVSVGVTVGGPSVVGWVPLAPRDVFRPYYPVSAVYVRGVNAGYRHLHPDPVRTVPTGPIMYTNQGVPGAVTVVPSNVLSARRPVAPAVAQVDLNVRNNLSSQPWQRHAPPPAPARVIPAPGGAVPVSPPGVRPPPPNANAQPGSPPQVIDLRRERIPQRPNPTAQAPAQPAIPTPAPAPAQPTPPVRDRRADEPGVRRDFNGRVPTPNRPAPVRVEPVRPPSVAPEAGPPARPAPAVRAPMPQQPPAAREAGRPAPPAAARGAAPAVREVQRVPQHPQPRGEPDSRGRGPEVRQPQQPRNQYQ
jgi:hypothetical protein